MEGLEIWRFEISWTPHVISYLFNFDVLAKVSRAESVNFWIQVLKRYLQLLFKNVL